VTDLSDPATYECEVPYWRYAWLRDNDPMHWHPSTREGEGFWAVTRYEDLVTISLDPGTYSSHRGGALIEDYEPATLAEQRLLMLNQDPPEHTAYREPAERAFTATVLASLEPQIRFACERMVRTMRAAGGGDAVSELAWPLAVATLGAVLDAPPGDLAKLTGWCQQMTGFDDPETGSSMPTGKAAAMDLYGYAVAACARQRAEPGAGPIAVLAGSAAHARGSTAPGPAAAPRAAELGEFQVGLLFAQFGAAATEAPAAALAGSVQALAADHGQWDRLRRDHTLLETAVEELFRWVSPVIYCRRTAACDTAMHGRRIAAGSKVVAFYPAAHRDPAVFSEPDRLDLGRDPNPQLAFGGGGPHQCLGQHLARLQLRILLETLLDQVSHMTVTARPRRLRSNSISGFRSLPIRLG
jgi:cholest-4-en-3-one 26-monooxygenase